MMTAAHDALRTFDRVELHDGEGPRTLTYEQYMEVPLERRVRWLLSGRPKFFAGSVEIPRRQALSLGR